MTTWFHVTIHCWCALHWILAVLIVAALALGALVMVKMPNTDPDEI